MTEYEIADLAASSVFELQGQVSLLQTAASMISDIVQQYMGILFGYIVAAYFIGASLGRRQVWIFTSLYVMWQIWMMGVIASRGYLALLLLDELQDSVSSTSVPFNISSLLTTSSLALLVAALFASLYFMWSVRHPKAG